ncbi:MgtC/SapB family protein [Selenomonas sp. TAMA-11512]|uniref:MgtC/SapB family protein n=1 Tax=Selenomonas sp. TAMA-11512 TaxID=3095337 RepID=UPI00308606AE|nr:MgtC/SapB family protein [Selenomonas sp. TAMA-11512]
MVTGVEWELIARLALSCVLGGIIGYERQSRRKSAGLRTNVLVCLGSCLIMILSQHLYMEVEGKTNADPARLAAQVVSGIGFLGAGAIMKEGLSVVGLTTAACLWVVAGVGLATGAGYYLGAFSATLFAFLTLSVLSRLDLMLIAHDRDFSMTIHTEDVPGQIIKIQDALTAMHLAIRTFKVKEAEDEYHDVEDTQRIIIELNIKNPSAVKRSEVVEAIRKIEGIDDVQAG